MQAVADIERPLKETIAQLTAELASVKGERDELKRDVDHAVKESKRREPDYPWDQGTASECVWALGESLRGTESACSNMHAIVKYLRPDLYEGSSVNERIKKYEEVMAAAGVEKFSMLDPLDKLHDQASSLQSQLTAVTKERDEAIGVAALASSVGLVEYVHGLHCRLSNATAEAGSLKSQLSTAEAELADLRRDAGRYRLLRVETHLTACGARTKEDLDARVDAELAKGQT